MKGIGEACAWEICTLNLTTVSEEVDLRCESQLLVWFVFGCGGVGLARLTMLREKLKYRIQGFADSKVQGVGPEVEGNVEAQGQSPGDVTDE